MPKEENQVEPGSSKSREHDQHVNLGVLLVHGIGTQRRGDTLLQAVEVLHHWFCHWLNMDIQLVDADITPSAPDSRTPAHALMVFPSEEQKSSSSWLFAECHWATTFRTSSFLELFVWAWRIVPWADLIHLVPRFRQALDLSNALQKSYERQKMSENTRRLFRRYVGRDPRLVDGLIDGMDILQIGLRAYATMVALSFNAMLLAVFGLVVLIILSLLLLLSFLLPIESVRQFALNVQLRLSATIGDSSAYLRSPLVSSAILTRLHHDLNWLAERCDRVVIVAHSQGAAVAYDAIQGWPWKGGREPKLTHLITYGSGLRKLFDIKGAQQQPVLWTFLGFLAFAFSVILVSLAGYLLSATSILAAVGVLFAALFTLFLVMMVLGAASGLANTDPELLDPASGGPEWDNLFASHDPVSSGPIAVSSNDTRAVNRFHERQREVTNRRSVLRDHTSYWGCTDDFVARVANRLLELSGGGEAQVFRAWITLSAERRRWRLRIRNSLRWVAAFVGLMSVLTSRDPGSVDDATREVFEGLTVQLYGLATWTIPPVSLPEWLFQTLMALVVMMIAFILADTGFALWERSERRQFFDRLGYRVPALPIIMVSAGWVAVIVALPIAAALLGSPQGGVRFDPLWPTLAALVLSAFFVWLGRKPPGTPEPWGLQLLEMGEELLQAANADREDLLEARVAFRMSQLILEPRRHKKSERAVRGLAEAQKRFSGSSPAAS
jgi:hypothetical protein